MVHVPISSRPVGNHAGRPSLQVQSSPIPRIPRRRTPEQLNGHGTTRCSTVLKAPPWVNTVPLTFARCVGGTPWCWVCWSPLLWRRWPMPAMMPGRAIPTTTASQSPEQTTSCVPACTFSRNPTVSVRDTAFSPLPVAMLLELPIPIPKTTTTACAGACRCIQIPTTSVQNAASRSTQATMGPTKVARNA